MAYSVLRRYAKPYAKGSEGRLMVRFIAAGLAALMLASGGIAIAQADQDRAYQLAREGHIRPLGEIIAAVTPRVGGKFIGSEFDANTTMYRLRFMRDGAVTNVDVDARTGRILGRGAF